MALSDAEETEREDGGDDRDAQQAVDAALAARLQRQLSSDDPTYIPSDRDEPMTSAMEEPAGKSTFSAVKPDLC